MHGSVTIESRTTGVLLVMLDFRSGDCSCYFLCLPIYLLPMTYFRIRIQIQSSKTLHFLGDRPKIFPAVKDHCVATMSTAPECDQTAGQLISLMEFGFLKVQQRLLRQELLLSELQANANIDAELTSDRHNNILNILKVIYNNTYNNSSNAGAKGIHESDFHKHVQPHLLKWTFHYSPLCFEIRY